MTTKMTTTTDKDVDVEDNNTSKEKRQYLYMAVTAESQTSVIVDRWIIKRAIKTYLISCETFYIWYLIIRIILGSNDGYESEMRTFSKSALLIWPRFLRVALIGRHFN